MIQYFLGVLTLPIMYIVLVLAYYLTKHKDQGKQALIGLDQLLNSMTPGGWADESWSSRSYRMDGTSMFWTVDRKLIDILFRVLTKETDHCKSSYEDEKSRTQEPPELRA